MQQGENKIETKFKKELYAWAREIGVNIQCLKFRVSGFNGWPDRLIMWEGYHCMFIEFKQPGGEYQPLQPYVIKMIRALGFIIEVHDDAKLALESVKGKVRATVGADSRDASNRKESRLKAIFASWEGENCDCAEGVFRIEGPESHRCVTCYRTLASNSHIVAQPIGTLGGLFTFKVCDNTRG